MTSCSTYQYPRAQQVARLTGVFSRSAWSDVEVGWRFASMNRRTCKARPNTAKIETSAIVTASAGPVQSMATSPKKQLAIANSARNRPRFLCRNAQNARPLPCGPLSVLCGRAKPMMS
mmetsp:Transcript_9254/g.15357  ORF Transcript_9254/g.15357 Transcript_9254/m.15357 type:complete len:118 (+) Transcript_9254:407-760(+)